jgi:hypothetical protein
LLLKISSFEPELHVIDEARRIFETADEDEVRELVIRWFFNRNPELFSGLIIDALRAKSGSQAELDFVKMLTRAGQPNFSYSFAAERLSWWSARPDPQAWIDWLHLMSGWKEKPVEVIAPAIATVLESRRRFEVQDQRLDELLMNNLARISPPRNETRRIAASEIARQVRVFLDHENSLVATEAVRALISLRDTGIVARFERDIQNKKFDLRIRCAMIKGLAVLGSSKSLPVLYRVGKEPMLAYAVIYTLNYLQDDRTLPYLKKLKKNKENIMVRQAAGHLIKKIKNNMRAVKSRKKKQR